MEYVTTHEHENVYSSGDGERADALSKPAGDGERADALSKLAGDGERRGSGPAGRRTASPAPTAAPPSGMEDKAGSFVHIVAPSTVAPQHQLPRPHELQIERLCS
jgi:hypothetical protein